MSTSTTLSEPTKLTDYSLAPEGARGGEVADKSKKLHALKAFEHTADYDSEIAAFFRKKSK
ncbi:MAG: hypothetical protein M1834_004687 [Cirrosporium novae-zelandiae]|nr:MAG: hypothetical protein M1834_004687 [Cirrosporium novae-zelandiae]